MHYYMTALTFVAGICFAFGILYLFMGLRRKDDRAQTLLLSLFALSYAAAVLTGIGNYSASSLAEWMSSARWDGIFVVLTWCSLIWFVAAYTRVRPRLFLWLLTAVFASTAIAHVSRANLIHETIFELAYVTLPWGEQLAYVEATDSVWATVFLAANLVTVGYVLVACALQFRRGERQPAMVLGAGMVWFIATIIVDILVDLGIAPIYLGDFGFLGLAIVLGLQLANEVIRTEEELSRYRRSLEGMVEERTAELERMNEQLESEIGERRRAEETLQRRVEELAVLSRITQTLVNVTDLPSALEQVCEAVAHQFDSQYTYVILPSTQEPDLQVLVGYDGESGPVGATQLPVSMSETPYFDRVLSQAETLTISDVQALPIVEPLRAFVAGQQIQNTMLVPLVVRGTAIGLLAIATDQADHVFTSDQALLAETIAGDVASAIENARLFEQAQAAAVAEERSRLARELHDSVTQTLYSVSIVAEALPRVLERNVEDAKRNARHMRQVVLGALAEMRTLLFELRPDAMEEASLDVLLEQLGGALRGRSRLPVEISIEGRSELPPEVKIGLYRIAQEAFNNIARHARATQVTVRLQHLPDRVILTIQDDGRGFDPDSVPAERMGLRFMRERAEGMGAELVIESELGRGTKLVVSWATERTIP